MVNLLKNASIQKKLLFVFGAMGGLVLLQFFVISAAMVSLSAVRAYVGGEGLWSKAQKSAVNDLQAYLLTANPDRYKSFEKELEVTLGGRQGRLELMKEDFNPEIVTEGFIKGKNHPDDIPRMIELIRRFHYLPQIKEVLNVWEEGDFLIDRLIALGKEIDASLSSGPLKREAELGYLESIRNIDNQLTELETKFSSTLGGAARTAETAVIAFLFSFIVLVNAAALLLIFHLGRYLRDGIFSLNSAAAAIGAGDFAHRVEIKGNDELANLAASVNKMASDLRNNIGKRVHAEELTKTKNLFLAHLGHEVRTPLGVILGYSELIGNQDLSDKEKRELAKLINRTGKEIAKLVDEVLDISKIELGKVSIERVDFNVGEFLEDQKALFKMRCEDKGVLLEFHKDSSVPELINCDPSRLRQILNNLISNAIKHTSRGSILIFATAKGNLLYFDIKDTGEGIPHEEQAKVFESFVRGSGSIVREGSGLGLPLAKRMARALGGNVELVSSRPGKGSHFRAGVVFSKATENETFDAKVIPFANIDLEGKRILVVDDREENQRLLEHILVNWGCDLEFASDGQEAVEKALNSAYNCILMDIQMPEMDGVEAARVLREAGFNGKILAFTGNVSQETRQRWELAGGNAFLSKPLSIAILIEALAET